MVFLEFWVALGKCSVRRTSIRDEQTTCNGHYRRTNLGLHIEDLKDRIHDTQCRTPFEDQDENTSLAASQHLSSHVNYNQRKHERVARS